MKSNIRKLIELKNLLEIRSAHVFCLIIFSILSSVLELISLATIVPFISVLISPQNLIEKLAELGLGFTFLVNSSDQELRLYVSVLFIGAIFFANLVRISWMWLQAQVGARLGNKMGIIAYRNFLYQDYQSHKHYNSGEVVGLLTTKINEVVAFIILPILSTISALLLLLLAFFALVFIDPVIIITVITAVGLTYSLISKIFKNKVAEYGQSIILNTSLENKTIVESLGGIRDLILLSQRDKFVDQFKKYDMYLKRSHANLLLIGIIPRYVIEFIVLSSIALVALLRINTYDDFSQILPTFALFALATQRVLPFAQLIYSNVNSMRAGYHILDEILPWLRPPSEKVKRTERALSFNREIEFKNVSFSYPQNDKPSLKNVNFKIMKGDWVGITGSSGSGKSTLLDLLMGLLIPTEGEVFIDGLPLSDVDITAWRQLIGHVSQQVFIFDDTIEINILLNDNKIGARAASDICLQLGLFENQLEAEKGVLKYVGERGGKLSGGQKQRIGIARALVRQSNVLVLDEATSALDKVTETNFLELLQKEFCDKTIFMISHNPDNLKYCNRVLEVAKGNVYVR